MTNEVIVQSDVQADVTPMSVIQLAVKQGANIEQLQKLFELQVSYEKNEARKAFAVAMVAFKAEPIEILKNKHVGFDTSKGRTEYDHATLHNVCAQIIDALRKHDLAHTWKPSTSDGKVSVTCILRHSMGHEESVTLDAKADDSGGKNGIQAIGSTITYLQRYSLLAATGLAVKGQDDDGNGASATGLSESQLADFAAAIDSLADRPSADALWNTIAEACTAAQDVPAYEALQAKMLAKIKSLKKAA